MKEFFEPIHWQWQGMLEIALQKVDPDYLRELSLEKNWLPGNNKLFAAFSLPLESTRYILMGESPYPRAGSANGYAFWDGLVDSLWSNTGLSKPVNRATSLRNWIKMLLVARGDLSSDTSQEAIAQLDKSSYQQTAQQLFEALLQRGFLLLNASLVYSKGKINVHARHWRPFIESILHQLAEYNRKEHAQPVQLILFGRIAQQIPESNVFKTLIAEHPYNLSFIHNTLVQNFFKPLDLLHHDY